MFTYTKENSYIYKFKTDKGSTYTIGFRSTSLDSTEIGIMRDIDKNESSNTVYEIMNTVNSIIDSYLKEYTRVNSIIFTVIGDDSIHIDKKSILFDRYINKFKKDYPYHSVVFSRLS